MKKLIAKQILYLGKIYDRLLMHTYKSLFNKCGRKVIFFPTNSKFLYKNISIGNNVSIGYGATFIAALSHITIGDNTIFSSNVTIRGGKHSCHIIGKLMVDYQVNDKNFADDQQVIISNDVCVGEGVIILKGVHIGRGAIIEPGAVINENVPPYAIVAGIPAKVKKFRWNVSDIIKHESFLYKEEERISEDELTSHRQQYN